MKHVALTLALLFATSVNTYAQTTSGSAEIIKPNPVVVVINAIPWLLKEREYFYYARVKAWGQTTEQARTEALRMGVEKAVGSVINSETHVVDKRLQRHEVINYSAGFVDRYEVVETIMENGLIVMTVDVWVKRSRIANRLLGEHRTPGHIDGQRLDTQTETINHSRQQGDRLLSAVLADFPKRAFDIEQGPSRVIYNDNRQRQLELSFKLRWRSEYLESLRETLYAVAQRPNAGDCVGIHAVSCDFRGYVAIKTNPGRLGRNHVAAFNDTQTLGLVYQHLIQSKPAVLITILDQRGREVWRGCQRWSALDNEMSGYVPNERLLQPGNNGIQINGYLVLDARVPFNLTDTTPTLDTVKMEVVRNNICPN